MRLCCLSLMTLCLLTGPACQNPGGSGKGLFSGGLGGSDTDEKWTIRCFHAEGPNHEERCQQLANMLRQVRNLKGNLVRVATDASGSTIYYGEYVKVSRKGSSKLVFPPEFQQDIALIRQLGVNQQAIFAAANPELLNKGKSPDRSDWDVSNAKGTYTLQVGVFYNTPTFHQRKWAAEEYVRILREEGISAYFRHQPGRSFVFVGDFEDSDLIGTGADAKFGPRIEKFIAQREDEFRHTLENGYPVKRGMVNGQMIVPPSILIPVPHDKPQY